MLSCCVNYEQAPRTKQSLAICMLDDLEKDTYLTAVGQKDDLSNLFLYCPDSKLLIKRI